MTEELRKAVIKSVQDLNARYPGNSNYHIVNEEPVGPYTVYSVEFSGTDDDRYTNFAVVRGQQVIRSFYYLSDVVRLVDRGLGWRALLIDQFGLVAGTMMIAILVVGLVTMLVLTGKAPEPLWVAVSSGVGYLFGSKGTTRAKEVKRV